MGELDGTRGRGFAVIDFETTGLFPGSNHRVIELAVVHLDENGRITGQWDTLINPNRDLGRQDIHRICAADVMRAPTFKQIAPRLVELLSGRVVVAHNARFDTGFLMAELDRIRYPTDIRIEALCTMQLARDFLPGAGRSLFDCCAAYDIEITDAHHALADAVATARLLEAYLLGSDDRISWDAVITRAAASPWPELSRPSAPWVPRFSLEAASGTSGAGFLERITMRLPDFIGPDDHLDYLALLDLSLLDRELTVREADAMVRLAEICGIDRSIRAGLHHRYFDDIAKTARADGVLSDEEIAELTAVAGLLEIEPDAVAAATVSPVADPSVPAESRPRIALKRGDTIVLTGDMARGRADWARELSARGFTVSSAVTMKTRLVVAADPDSLSGKAGKARDYGIPIVSEFGLRSLIGVG